MRRVTVLVSLIYLLFSIPLFVPCDLCEAAGNTIYVDDSGGGDYTSIQEAINIANESDIIYVYSGIYNENLVINKTIILQGEGSGSTTISGSGDHTVKIFADNVSISGFTIKNTGVSSSFSSVFLNSVSNCTIENNVVKNAGNGLYLVSTSNNIVKDNTFEFNNIGIYFSNADGNVIQRNDIKNNNAYGVYLGLTSSNNVFYLNDFLDNVLNNAYDKGSNSWSYNSQGNYWDDYNDYDSDGDGVGDNPYEIDADSYDNYPLGYFLTYNAKPIAYIDSISPNPVTQGQKVYFNGHGTDDGFIIEWEWKSSKDGLLSTAEDFSTAGLSVGTHTIRFRVKDDEEQWSDYVEETLVVNPAGSQENQRPTAEIVTVKPSEATVGESVYFHGYGIDSDGVIVSYSWRSSIDGVLSSSSTFTTSNLSVGYHMIYFKVQDNQGKWSKEDITSLRINPDTSSNKAPTPDAGGPYVGVINSTVTFDASESFDNDGDTIVSYVWDFGDGTSGTGIIVQHTYVTSGNYTVVLTVTDDHDNEAMAITYANISATASSGNDTMDTTMNGEETPGFEIIIVAGLVFLLGMYKKRFPPARK